MNQSQQIMESLGEVVSSFDRVLRNEIIRILQKNPDMSDDDVFKHILGGKKEGDKIAISGHANNLSRDIFNPVMKRARVGVKKHNKAPAFTAKAVLKTMRGG